MAMLRDIRIDLPKSQLDNAVLDKVKDKIADEAWRLYHRYKDDVVVSKHIFFFRIQLRVKDIPYIYQLFEKLFGPEPETVKAAFMDHRV